MVRGTAPAYFTGRGDRLEAMGYRLPILEMVGYFTFQGCNLM